MVKRPGIVRDNSTQGSSKRGQDSDREMAATSRDDKLFDAADARTVEGSVQVSHQLPHSLEPSGPGGEALTTANMEKHEKEEAFKFENRTSR
jgi:cytochrome c556